MINRRLAWFSMALALVGLGGHIPHLAAAPTQPSGAPQTRQLPVPPTTPPPNRTRSGGSLSGGATCGTVAEPLIALIPVENPVLTQSAHPTLLLYVPYGASQVQGGDFSILVGLDELTRHYHTRFTLPTTPGIVSLSLPDHPDLALQEGELYHWYVKLDCGDGPNAALDLTVDGWIQRVAASGMEPMPATTPVIWYDTLAGVRARLQANPTDAALQQQWRSLLAILDLEDLADSPYVGAAHLLAPQSAAQP